MELEEIAATSRNMLRNESSRNLLQFASRLLLFLPRLLDDLRQLRRGACSAEISNVCEMELFDIAWNRKK